MIKERDSSNRFFHKLVYKYSNATGIYDYPDWFPYLGTHVYIKRSRKRGNFLCPVCALGKTPLPPIV